MKISGVELDFDFCDADQAEVYEREVRRVVERVQDKKQYEGKSNAEGIRIQCGIVDEFFDAVFGSGTADLLFHGKSNLREHLEAFGAVSDAARESNAELLELSARYSPNRAARRQAQKQQKERTEWQGHDSNRLIGFAGDPGPKGELGLRGDVVENGARQGGGQDILERITRILPVLESFADAQGEVRMPPEGRADG